MNGFFGLYCPFEEELDTEMFQQACGKILHNRPYLVETYRSDNIVLCFSYPEGNIPAAAKAQPMTSVDGALLLIGYYSLQYRDELGDKLGLTQHELLFQTDAALVLKSYQKWGKDCVRHLEGDWAFVILDHARREFIMFKDSYGFSALFYSLVEKSLIFASDPELFYHLPAVLLEIDEVQFARLCINGVQIEEGKTLLKDVFSLKNAALKVFDRSMNCETLSFENRVFPQQRFRYPEDAAFALESSLTSAILTRIRGDKAGLFLSAGLDSSAVAYYTAMALAFKGKDLRTYTSLPEYLQRFSAEKQVRISEHIHVLEFVKKFQNIKPEFMDFKGVGFKLFFENDYSGIVSPVVTPNYFWIDGIYARASGEGIGMVLNAQMGNYTISWNAPFLALRYLMGMRFRKFFKYIWTVYLRDPVECYRVVKHEILLPACTYPVNAIKRMLFLKLNLYRWHDYVVSRHVKGKMGVEVDFSKEFIPGYSNHLDSRQLRIQVLFNQMKHAHVLGYLWSYKHGVTTADPTSDARLIKTSLAIPEDFFNFLGEKKSIYKKLMGGKIKDQLLHRSATFPQAYDIGWRLSNDPYIFNCIAQLEKDEKLSELFDFGAMKRQMELFSSVAYDINVIKHSAEIMKALSLANWRKKIVNLIIDRNNGRNK